MCESIVSRLTPRMTVSNSEKELEWSRKSQDSAVQPGYYLLDKNTGPHCSSLDKKKVLPAPH